MTASSIVDHSSLTFFSRFMLWCLRAWFATLGIIHALIPTEEFLTTGAFSESSVGLTTYIDSVDQAR